jgi:LPXTG-motif cell wall-anchored protein
MHIPDNVRQPSAPTRSTAPPQMSVRLAPSSSGPTARGSSGGGGVPVPFGANANPVSGGYIPTAQADASVPSVVPFTPASPNTTPDASAPDTSAPDVTVAPDAPFAVTSSGARVTQTARSGVPVLAIVAGVVLLAGAAGVVLYRKKKR